MEKTLSRTNMAHEEVIGSSHDNIPQGHIDTTYWWRYKNLRALNLWILVPLLSIFSQGLVSLLSLPDPLSLRAGGSWSTCRSGVLVACASEERRTYANVMRPCFQQDLMAR
jgi:hypothetical protein